WRRMELRRGRATERSTLPGAGLYRLLLHGEIELAPGFVDGDGHGVGQVQAATVGTHWQAQAPLGGERFADVGGQATALRAKQKRIATLECNAMEWLRAFGGERKDARLAE